MRGGATLGSSGADAYRATVASRSADGDRPAVRLCRMAACWCSCCRSGPGLCGGDRLAIDVTAGRRTRVAVTTTAATRVMSMDPEPARRAAMCAASGDEDDARVPIPACTIPYPASALMQTIEADAAAGSRTGIVECWAMGRIARNPNTCVSSPRQPDHRDAWPGGGRYVDALRLEPAATDLAATGVLAGRAIPGVRRLDRDGCTTGRPACSRHHRRPARRVRRVGPGCRLPARPRRGRTVRRRNHPCLSRAGVAELGPSAGLPGPVPQLTLVTRAARADAAPERCVSPRSS